MATLAIPGPDIKPGTKRDYYLPQSTIQITKQYKGLEIHQQVHLVEVHSDYVIAQACDPHYCPVLEGDVRLHSQVFAPPILAKAEQIEHNKGTFIISDFSYADYKNIQRTSERVQPKSPTHISLRWKYYQFRAVLTNVSLWGMGVLAPKEIVNIITNSRENKLYCDLRLPPDFQWDNLPGKPIYWNKVDNSLIQLGLLLNPDPVQACQLDRYLELRKTEILADLEEYCRKTVEKSYYLG